MQVVYIGLDGMVLRRLLWDECADILRRRLVRRGYVLVRIKLPVERVDYKSIQRFPSMKRISSFLKRVDSVSKKLRVKINLEVSIGIRENWIVGIRIGNLHSSYHSTELESPDWNLKSPGKVVATDPDDFAKYLWAGNRYFPRTKRRYVNGWSPYCGNVPLAATPERKHCTHAQTRWCKGSYLAFW